jgi:hypothetical protein
MMHDPQKIGSVPVAASGTIHEAAAAGSRSAQSGPAGVRDNGRRGVINPKKAAIMSHVRLIGALLAAAATVAACDSSPSGMNHGRLTIQLTDAPGDLQEAFVRIDRVVIRSSGETEGGWIELQPDQGGFIDLLTLSGGRVLNLVEEALVPTGSYSELRVVIGDAYVRLNDGRVFATSGATLPVGTVSSGTLRCPSCAQSGFKVKFTNGDMRVENNATVLIDFDVARSFGHQAGASGQWIMRPVLRATTRTVQLGSIAGSVTFADGVAFPTCGEQTATVENFRPIAVAGTDTVTATVDAQGAFRFSHLLPGSYTLGSMPFITFTSGDTIAVTAAASPAVVNLAEGADASADYVISAAVCQ